MDFFLLVLLNLALFLRPSEIFPALAEIPIYNILIVTTAIVVAPRIVANLHPDRLARQPISVCVLALIPAIMLSHLSHFDMWSARFNAFFYFKTVAYYIVLISVVDTTERLRLFLYSVAIAAALSCAVAVLHFYEVIQIPTLTVLQENAVDEETGEVETIPRLRATGIFNDPNDLSMFAVTGIMICLLGLGDKRLGLIRVTWVGPLAVFGTALILTKSRGGFLALFVGLGTLTYLRIGFWKTAILFSVVLPVVLQAGGRQTDIGAALSGGGTGNGRIEIWREGLMAMRAAPVFGIGMGGYADETGGYVAHNSFVHAFVELGVFGGAFFLGAFWFAARSLVKLRRQLADQYRFLSDAELRRMLPCCLAILFAVCMSLFSLSRTYVVPTYIPLGVFNACSLAAQRAGVPPVMWCSSRHFLELACFSVAFLIVILIIVRLIST